MSTSGTHSDALVFLGATGDLAYKKVFPALQTLIQHGHLDLPIVGVAKAGWNLEQFRARARDSLAHHGGVARLRSLGLVRGRGIDSHDAHCSPAARGGIPTSSAASANVNGDALTAEVTSVSNRYAPRSSE